MLGKVLQSREDQGSTQNYQGSGLSGVKSKLSGSGQNYQGQVRTIRGQVRTIRGQVKTIRVKTIRVQVRTIRGQVYQGKGYVKLCQDILSWEKEMVSVSGKGKWRVCLVSGIPDCREVSGELLNMAGIRPVQSTAF